MSSNAQATRRPQPLILIRGFGGLGVEDEKKVAYQGFNDGTVYPQKRGENYIYEGLILRFMKSGWKYQDATNVVGYYGSAMNVPVDVPEDLKTFPPDFFFGNEAIHQIIFDPAMALHLVNTASDPLRTLWVFRYYDLNHRNFDRYGKAILRLIEFIRAIVRLKTGLECKVNIIAHSMGGLLVREAVQKAYPDSGLEAATCINKIVTLGTPHQGISFQFLKDWISIDAEEELERFNPKFQSDEKNPVAYVNFHKHFPLRRLLTVVGTNYRSYNVAPTKWLNRIFSVSGEFGPNYNRSDGLVKQSFAQIPGAPRTFVHKCHGGFDSLVTARESFEVATRFLFGNIRAALRLVKANVTRGLDMFGKSEIFLGVSIKPRRVDFELFHQSAEAENCYGPFRTSDLSDDKVAFSWAGPERLIWEGWFDTESAKLSDLVLRLDFYVGERDLLGVGFSDNVIFRKQYYIRALLKEELELYLYPDERFAADGFQHNPADALLRTDVGWQFSVKGTGFEGTFQIETSMIPEEDTGP